MFAVTVDLDSKKKRANTIEIKVVFWAVVAPQ